VIKKGATDFTVELELAKTLVTL